MSFEQIISILTVITTISVKVIGIPSQIRKIHKTKSVESISILHFGLGFLAYLLWTIHGVLKMDWTIIIGQSIGIVTSGFLLCVIIYYREKVIQKETSQRH